MDQNVSLMFTFKFDKMIKIIHFKNIKDSNKTFKI